MAAVWEQMVRAAHRKGSTAQVTLRWNTKGLRGIAEAEAEAEVEAQAAAEAEDEANEADEIDEADEADGAEDEAEAAAA